MKSVIIYTDGGCDGNPGPGGWAAVLLWNGKKKELSGGEPATTNNRMEMTAALEGLRILKEPCAVQLFTDSQYLRKGITEWLPRWKKRGWQTSAKTPVKNEDLWRKLEEATLQHKVTWQWVKGHAGNRNNERCDELAGLAIRKIREKQTPAELRAHLQRYLASEQDSGAASRAPALF